MNTQLEMLFEKYNISEKNRYEINQFFFLLPSHKKRNLLNNFETLAFKLNKIEEDLKIQREILVPDLLSKIKSVMEKVELQELKNQIKNDISQKF